MGGAAKSLKKDFCHHIFCFSVTMPWQAAKVGTDYIHLTLLIPILQMKKPRLREFLPVILSPHTVRMSGRAWDWNAVGLVPQHQWRPGVENHPAPTP